MSTVSFESYIDGDDISRIFGVSAAENMGEEVTLYVEAWCGSDDRGGVDVEIEEVRLDKHNQDSCVLSEMPADILPLMQEMAIEKWGEDYESRH